jgi:uncharacterized protein (DUF1697 family)
MVTYVAMLRGVNVSGHNKLAMSDLRALCEELGCTDVVTYIQSGNVVCQSPLTAAALARGIERALLASGVRSPVIVRTAAQLQAVRSANPFLARRVEAERLYVTFLADRPAPARVRQLGPTSGPDELIVSGREVYLHCPGGYGNTKLNNSFVEKQLTAVATTRNWRTVNKLVELTAP